MVISPSLRGADRTRLIVFSVFYLCLSGGKMRLKSLQKRKVFKQKKVIFKKFVIFAFVIALISTLIYFAYRAIDSKITKGK